MLRQLATLAVRPQIIQAVMLASFLSDFSQLANKAQTHHSTQQISREIR